MRQESDSYPQTMPGYYGCQTLAHVSSWRQLLEDPLLPWIFVHLQPYHLRVISNTTYLDLPALTENPLPREMSRSAY